MTLAQIDRATYLGNNILDSYETGGHNLFVLRPYQIVSLWDMLRKYGSLFFILVRHMVGFEDRLKELDGEVELTEKTRAGIKRDFPKFANFCETLGLNSSVDQLNRILIEVDQQGARYKTLKELMPELNRRLHDDLKRAEFIHVPASRINYYVDDQPQFGTKVADRFPKSVEDIQEAGKCFALARYTATVFHLMRVMEAAVQYLGKRLNISLVSEKNWHNILDEVDKAVKALPSTSGPQKKRRNKLSEASAHLRMVKDAWRNDVMHPKETYTEEEAERVFRNVKDFMVHLAAKL